MARVLARGSSSRTGPTTVAGPAYPIMLDLRGRPCLVVGGGAVAERKVDGLLAAGARVTVVSPRVTDRLRGWIERGRCRHKARVYRRGDVARHTVVLVATNDDRATAQVCREARQVGALVNAADDPVRCDFYLPAIVRRGRLTVAVSTGGASPALAAAVRDELERLLPSSHALLLEVVAEVRARMRGRAQPASADRWRAAIDGRLRALVARGRGKEAVALLAKRLAG